MTQFTEHYFHAQDDVRLYYRDYGNRRSSRTPLLCLSGLTRNSKDFHDIACRHAETRRVITLDYRGRGRSAYDPNPQNYQVPVYINDVMHLLAVTHVHRAVVLGTSMGGIVAMGVAVAIPTALAGVILNDVGPEISETGRRRIAGYVGTQVHVPDYDAAADLWRQNYAGAYPRLDGEGWLKLAKATFTEDPQRSGLRLDYDLNIAVPLREQAHEPLPDLWPLFRALRHVPLLALRGAFSDILTADTFVRMKREHAGMIAVTVPNVGHVPMLDETEAQSAIDAFLTDL
ncbi:alpha/beta hydrolase [uncultured Ferrovibrio sp.]|jgi:Predicted hydrolases or acyltransferases (alpha/beta hydrolase superfamily)|uniref:alpha/beta fold hydrolase n=1 Tax=uncultured Ferrovibrio sp. TaxID=1576913 RepID=UPI0026119605|nr:alpha/beta hydrolase [uncultured Ferrovibrio sp.]